MTIIKPSQYRNYIRFLLLLFGLMFTGGLLYVHEYNMFVDARYAIKKMKNEIIELESLNADLKNELYAKIDSSKLEMLAKDKSLFLETRPGYIKSNQWLSDLSY